MRLTHWPRITQHLQHVPHLLLPFFPLVPLLSPPPLLSMLFRKELFELIILAPVMTSKLNMSLLQGTLFCSAKCTEDGMYHHILSACAANAEKEEESLKTALAFGRGAVICFEMFSVSARASLILSAEIVNMTRV